MLFQTPAHFQFHKGLLTTSQQIFLLYYVLVSNVLLTLMRTETRAHTADIVSGTDPSTFRDSVQQPCEVGTTDSILQMWNRNDGDMKRLRDFPKVVQPRRQR